MRADPALDANAGAPRRVGGVILVTNPFPAELIARVAAAADPAPVRQVPPNEIDDALWATVEVLYTGSALPAPDRAPALRWVQLHLAGVEDVLRHPLFATDVRFSTLSGVHAVAMAEYVFATLLALRHRVPTMLEWQQRGEWPPDSDRWRLFVPEPLWGRTLAVLGYGSIGRQVARVARAFGMRVLAVQRGTDRGDRGFAVAGAGDPEGVLADGFFPPTALHEVLAQSDVVVLSMPLTDQTRGLIDAHALRAMKPSAVLVNVARGALCDEDALVAALHDGTISGAVLDVFGREPLPTGHPLWRVPNAVLSPHVAGFTPQYDEWAVNLFCDNLRRDRAGLPLLNEVNKTLGY
jgi:phosphoglycerate dehydrogenase-like enzyme